MVKIFLLGTMLFALVSCKTDKSKQGVAEASAYEITIEKWPKITLMNSKTKAAISEWQEFKDLEISLEALYTVGNTEDLSLVLEDVLEKQKGLETSTYPKPFDLPQIKSRQKVFHTFLLKAKGDLVYRIDAQTSVLQMIAAHNAVLNHFNSITSNTLDLKKLLEEEAAPTMN